MAWWLHVRAAPHVTVMDYGFGWVSWRAWELQVWKRRPGDIQSTLEASSIGQWQVDFGLDQHCACWNLWMLIGTCFLDAVGGVWDFAAKTLQCTFLSSEAPPQRLNQMSAGHSILPLIPKGWPGPLSGRWRKYVDLMESLSCRWHHNSGWTESCHLAFPIAVFAVTIRC